jgi:hypothetical protein
MGRRGDHVSGGVNQQHMAIGLGNRPDPDRAAGTDAILDHDRLAELCVRQRGDL